MQMCDMTHWYVWLDTHPDRSDRGVTYGDVGVCVHVCLSVLVW